MLMAQPDAVLCKLATRGNANAYEVLYGRYHQPVLAFVYHLLGRKDGVQDCEDIVQDTFAKAFAGIREKRIDGSFRSWIYTIARNRTYDLIRARKPNDQSLDAATTEMPSAAEHTETDRHAEQRVELAWLVAAVSDLPERQREALLMRELGGMSHNQIASQLDTTVSATKKLIGRGRATVTKAATIDGYRPRRLGRDLAMAAPVVPLTLTGLGLGAAGGGTFIASSAATGSAAGGAAFGGKTAATVLAVVALGGGAAVVESDRSTSSDARQQSISEVGSAANAAAASEREGDRGDDGTPGRIPVPAALGAEAPRETSREDRPRSDRESDGMDDNRRRGDREDENEPRPAAREHEREYVGRDDTSGHGGENYEQTDLREPERLSSGSNSGPGGSDGGVTDGPEPDSFEPGSFEPGSLAGE